MKEKGSEKESIKEKAERKGHAAAVFSREDSEPAVQEDLKIDWDAFLRFFNGLIDTNGSNIAKVPYLSRGMKRNIQMLVYEWNSKGALVDACIKLVRSDFLNGRKKKFPFLASLLWMIESKERFEKVMTGYYDNPPELEPTPEALREQEAEERARKEAERRALAKQIEEEERAERQRRREEAERNKATPEELQEIFARINKHMPPAADKKRT